jgi:hypothetical protein
MPGDDYKEKGRYTLSERLSDFLVQAELLLYVYASPIINSLSDELNKALGTSPKYDYPDEENL